MNLPNGSELSYEAFVDFGNSFLRPDVVLRDPEGVIIGKEIGPYTLPTQQPSGLLGPNTIVQEQIFPLFGLQARDW